jgi:BA14K-like protein
MASRPGQAGSFLFYAAVLLVAASSVAFGLNWMQAPLPPMPETEASVQAAKLAAHLPPPRPVVAKVAPRSVYPGRPQPKASQAGRAVAAADATSKEQSAPAPNIMTPGPSAQPTPAASAQPKCDVAACSAAYHSFRASDCTWQPFDGPRRFCDKGQPAQEAALTPDAAIDPAQYSDKCDIEACRHAYFTFDPTDCTYQPSNGPRRLCTKGTPPKPKSAEAPAGAPPSNAPASAATAPVSNKCDVEACKRAYVTFNPADCTYKPSLYGPRQLCTKGTPPPPEAKAEPAASPPPAAAVPPAAAEPPKNEPVKQEANAPAAAVPPAAAPPSAVVAPSAPAAAPPAPAAAAPPVANTPPAAAPTPVVSNKCDVEACRRAYVTFNPADCTYKPSLYGPRQLCTKGTPPPPEAKAEPASPPPAAAQPPKNEPVKQEANAPAAVTPPAAALPSAVAAPPAPATAPPAATAPAATPPPAANAPPAAAPTPVVSNKCDVEACKRAYFTFNPADCTYQPSDGPRRLCTKGTPPKPEAKAEPGASPPPAAATSPNAVPPAATPNKEQGKQEAPAVATAPAAATPPVANAPPAAAPVPLVSDKCDVEACKRAYFTFNPADCTYQPSDGPRRLCTKRASAGQQAPAPSAARAPRPGPAHPVPPGFVPAGR